MADPVDQDRLPYGGLWTGLVGVAGGIPSDAWSKNADVTLGGVAATNRTNINNAINAAAGTSQYILLPSGTYDVSGDLSLDESGVEVRGATDANGVATTTLNFTASSDYLVKVRGASWDLGTTTQWTRKDVDTGATRGSTSVHVTTTPTGLSAGMLVFLSSTLGIGADIYDLYGTDSYIHISRCTGVSGQDISFEDPINADYLAGTIRVGYRTTAGVTIRKSGLRNLNLTKSGSGDGWYVDFEGCDECWMWNVNTHTVGSNQSHIRFYGAYRPEIRHCDIQHMTDLTNSTYCIYADKSNAALIIDNYFHDCPNVMPIHGLGGAAFVQNYVTDLPYNPLDHLSQIVFAHGSHNHFILIEGNWVSSSYHDDGGTSQCFTYLRNRMLGWDNHDPKTGNSNVITTCYGHANFTMAENVMGYDTHHTTLLRTFVGTDETNANAEEVIYNLQTPDVTGTFEKFNNYNTVTDGIPAGEVAADVPDSYLFAAKPDNFGICPWPWVDSSNYSQSNDPENFPAGYRAINGEDPPASESGGTATIGKIGFVGKVTIR